MTTYKQCAKCGKWTEYLWMDDFVGIGEICGECKRKLLEKVPHVPSRWWLDRPTVRSPWPCPSSNVRVGPQLWQSSK